MTNYLAHELERLARLKQRPLTMLNTPAPCERCGKETHTTAWSRAMKRWIYWCGCKPEET